MIWQAPTTTLDFSADDFCQVLPTIANKFYFLALYLSLKYYSPASSRTLSVSRAELLFKALVGKEVLDPMTVRDPKEQQEQPNSQLTILVLEQSSWNQLIYFSSRVRKHPQSTGDQNVAIEAQINSLKKNKWEQFHCPQWNSVQCTAYKALSPSAFHSRLFTAEVHHYLL